MTLTWQSLFMSTLRSPDEAAEAILSIEMPRSVVFEGLLMAAALNALMSGIMLFAFPLPAGFPGFLASPLAYFVMVAGGLALLAQVLTWTGRGMGGVGALDDMLKLMVWLQVVRVVLQAVGLVLLLAVPMVGTLFNLAMGLLSIWILLNFVKAGHKLASIGSAAVVVFVAVVGLVLGLSLLLALAGVGSIGGPLNV